mmetsp:Transcript_30464/g.74997  ORF Transcript_30464/g.74997 Transcript_30464/m.74997 type:complete len:179 (-) Transcript_30464:131-667(-)|eukprot:2154374-Prymnesium_polylepis.1
MSALLLASLFSSSGVVNQGILSPARVTRAALGVASQGMSIIKPVFQAEAALQASVLGSDDDRAAAVAQLDSDIQSAPVVIYTYGLSPFSTEAIAFLEETGCKYKKIELGLEWFLLGGQGSCLRAVLLERYGVSSLPHAFVGGQSVGGLYSGNNQGMPGLVGLKKGGKLAAMLKEAKAL